MRLMMSIMDVTIYLWQFLQLSTKTALTIKNCQTVRFYFGAFLTRNDFIQLLHIQNVQNLHFIPATLSHNPPTIIFENITNIENIPANTFSQMKYKSPDCFAPTCDLGSIVFQNIKIGTIETGAFVYLKNMEYFRWENVSVRKIETGGVKIKGKGDLNMQILNSDIKVLESLAIQVVGEKLIVLGSTISEVSSSAFNATLHFFEFSYNLVKNIQSGAFSVLAQDVDITANHFEHLHSGALQKIGPGVLRNSAKPKFAYNFRQNFIKDVDAGGLHPDISAYKNSTANVVFANNSLHCTCEGLGWLGSEVHLGVGYYHLEDFHKMVLAVKNNNTCAFLPCKLPLTYIRKLILASGKCKEASRMEVCGLYKPGQEAEKNVTSNLGSIGTVNMKNIFLMVVFTISKIWAK